MSPLKVSMIYSTRRGQSGECQRQGDGEDDRRTVALTWHPRRGSALLPIGLSLCLQTESEGNGEKEVQEGSGGEGKEGSVITVEKVSSWRFCSDPADSPIP
ncbi:unnamed protein product [Pleuronectes platessa]|uniref:Uncharacterized protein n=1 Tax=Pleuronectes platessa TaxID=8262 RepID=A0A9N7VDS6_PLEPL|nr:unnamed protein product [Pleuronectes platessa]